MHVHDQAFRGLFDTSALRDMPQKKRIFLASYKLSESSRTTFDYLRRIMDGYHKLASLMSDHEELFMLRRFDMSNAMNLLYMQAEILHLEAELHDIALEDHSGSEKHRNYEYSVFDLKESSGSRGSDTQWRKILELREKLKEYSKLTYFSQATRVRGHLLRVYRKPSLDDAALRYNQICGLPKANPGNLKFFRNWLNHDEGGHLFLQGREAWTWDPCHTDDIISISGMSTNEDMLSQCINDRLIPWYHRKLGHYLNVKRSLRRLPESI
jgi:hypothetical protein